MFSSFRRHKISVGWVPNMCSVLIIHKLYLLIPEILCTVDEDSQKYIIFPSHERLGLVFIWPVNDSGPASWHK